MALPVGKGQKVSQYEDILGDLVKTVASADAGVICGEVYAVGPFIVISGYTVTKAAGTNLATFPGWVEGHYVVRKKAGTAWSKGDALTFEAVAGHDYLTADVAVAGEAIHAYAFKDALSADTEGQIIGPFLPPFQVSGTMADILAAILTADAGQVLVADGTGGVSVTDWTVPVADGAVGEILKLSSANVTGWAADSDIVKTLAAGKAAGQIIVADGSDGVDVTAYHVVLTDGTAGQQLTTDAALGVTWSASGV